MDRLITPEEFEREIEETMVSRGVDYGDAEVIVAMKYGELHGDGDLLYMGRLTDEQRRLHRRTLLEVMADLGELDDEPAASVVSDRGNRVAD